MINRNNRLKRLLDIGAPEIMTNNEKRMLQEAVDALFDNGRRGRPVQGPGNRALKSLSDMLKGKQGRFRQNLLGKRVDYSGRSVIVVGPQLKLHQCGLPKQMALELFKPFVMKRLVDLNHAQNIKSAKRMVERSRPVVWDVLEEVITEHPVLLNRAPRCTGWASRPSSRRLIEGKAIQIHPLVCTAFNADFDGDQMAVHLPLSAEAQAEARVLMLSATTSCRRPTVDRSRRRRRTWCWASLPDHREPGRRGRGSCLRVDLGSHDGVRLRNPRSAGSDSAAAVQRAPAHGHDGVACHLARRRAVPAHHHAGPGAVQRGDAGRGALRQPTGGQERTGSDRQPARRVLHQGRGRGGAGCAQDLGFPLGHAFRGDDLDRGRRDPPAKANVLAEAEEKAAVKQKAFDRGLMTEQELNDELIEIWIHATDQVAEAMRRTSRRPTRSPRWSTPAPAANMNQLRQIAGMRGLVANPKGETIPRPIKSNFREGLSVLEYFISTHGARRGLADTALRTADSGYPHQAAGGREPGRDHP